MPSGCEALEQRGLHCWLASRDISPGENFQEAIVRAIGSARAMVLVFSGSANNSDEIKKEIALASHYHLAVIPVRVEDVLPTDAFLYELSTRQWIDAFDDWDRAMCRLADQIGRPAGGPVAVPAAPSARPRRRRAVAWGVAAALAATALATGAAYSLAGKPAAPARSVEPAATRDLSGTWVTSALINPYDHRTSSMLHLEIEQSGDSLFGTVRETIGKGDVMRGIEGGQVKGDVVVFYTQGVITIGSGEQPYKEHYLGTRKGGAIEFIRRNDVATGGVPQRFTATRE